MHTSYVMTFNHMLIVQKLQLIGNVTAMETQSLSYTHDKAPYTNHFLRNITRAFASLLIPSYYPVFDTIIEAHCKTFRTREMYDDA